MRALVIVMIFWVNNSLSQNVLILEQGPITNQVMVEMGKYDIYIERDFFFIKISEGILEYGFDSLKNDFTAELETFRLQSADSLTIFQLSKPWDKVFNTFLYENISSTANFIIMSRKRGNRIQKIYINCKCKRSHGPRTCKYFADERNKKKIFSYHSKGSGGRPVPYF